MVTKRVGPEIEKGAAQAIIDTVPFNSSPCLFDLSVTQSRVSLLDLHS